MSNLNGMIRVGKLFKEIKASVSKAPVLVSPDYCKDFKIFSFVSEDTIALLQESCSKQMTKAMTNPLLT